MSRSTAVDCNPPRVSPRVLDRLMPTNCQVVMESCSGIRFCTDVLRLGKPPIRERFNLWEVFFFLLHDRVLPRIHQTG